MAERVLFGFSGHNSHKTAKLQDSLVLGTGCHQRF
jgi:hypothetical protein